MQTQEGDDLERLTSHQKGFLGGRVAQQQKRQSGAYHPDSASASRWGTGNEAVIPLGFVARAPVGGCQRP